VGCARILDHEIKESAIMKAMTRKRYAAEFKAQPKALWAWKIHEHT
jgi:hypothetical protein